MNAKEMKLELMAVVRAIGNPGLNQHPYQLNIDTNQCLVSWTYWDDDDDEQFDDDGYIKVLYALFINDRHDLVCQWDGNFGETFDSLEHELQVFIYDKVMAWVEELENEATAEK